MFRKLVASLLLVSVVMLQVQPALAQTPSPETPAAPTPAAPAPAAQTPAPEQPGTAASVRDCTHRGSTDGSKTSTGGAFTVGLTSGLLLGLLGTAIAYFGQGEPRPTADQAAANTDPACRLAYEDAYGEAGRKKKKRSALIGGLIGTAAIVTVIVASGGQ